LADKQGTDAYFFDWYGVVRGSTGPKALVCSARRRDIVHTLTQLSKSNNLMAIQIGKIKFGLLKPIYFSCVLFDVRFVVASKYGGYRS
jgi:hypothetical protein